MNEQRGHSKITVRARDGAAAAFCCLSMLQKLFLSLERAAMLRQTCLCDGVKKQPLIKEKLEVLKLSASAAWRKYEGSWERASSWWP